jgi:hypothetical protein
MGRIAPSVALGAALGCAGAPEGPTLPEVAEKVPFDVVDRLGPHVATATTRVTETRAGQEPRVRTEVLEIRWSDWENFESARSVDGARVSTSRVVAGRGYVERYGAWQALDEAEPLRQELRIAWDAWGAAMDPFDDRLVLDAPDGDIVEGRPATRYTVRLAEAPARAKAKRKAKAKAKGDGAREMPRSDAELLSLAGSVVLDDATAVRLVAEVTGEYRQGTVQRTVALSLARTGIGTPIPFTVPTDARPAGSGLETLGTPP